MRFSVIKIAFFSRKGAKAQKKNKKKSLLNLCSFAPLREYSVLLCSILCTICLLNSSARAQSTTDNKQPATNSQQPKTILIFGNSLTAGYGLDPSQAFPALLQQKIDSLDWHFRVIGAGLSGETSAGGLRRIDWILRRNIDVLILELGGNDGLRGISLEDTEKNLQAIIDKTQKAYQDVKIILAGMQVPPNLGPEYTTEFQSIYPALAKQYGAALIPFLLEGVGGIPELNLADRIHPNIEGHKIVAENVWKVLEKVLVEFQEK
ncbi:MAG: arylesterase [bacterium]